MKILKEALERVRQTEQENNEKKQALLNELTTYDEEKELELETIQKQQKQERKAALDKLQTEHNQLLSKKTTDLAEAVALENQTYQRTYEKNRTIVLNEIIEGVKQANGSQSIK